MRESPEEGDTNDLVIKRTPIASDLITDSVIDARALEQTQPSSSYYFVRPPPRVNKYLNGNDAKILTWWINVFNVGIC